ncbi:ribonuclease T2 family protein [Mycolicibacterium vanbaalenii]|uniref:ribonuclease T2 family protein n=1 Tax=Mycolicibacterium vanbaalenii TaxID=110539 RepID=UPI0023BAF99F|nr:ribonuclease T(2) [Mycolicibacterium vanbaalenii]
MARGDAVVFSISAALAGIVVAAVTYSVVVLDKVPNPSALVSDGAASSWLVLTWAPSFCRVEPSNPACTSGEVEQKGQTLLLHGLWPQPPDRQNCGVPRAIDERQLPPVDLAGNVRAELQATMVDTASLTHHEWYTHGTCSGVSPDTYFGDAATLTDDVRRALDPVFRDASGGRLTLAEVRRRIDATFGAGTGERVALGCRKTAGEGSVVVDVRLSLPPVVALRGGDGVLALDELLAEGPPMPAQCRHGRVPA